MLDEGSSERFRGKVKFLNWEKNYGFIIKEKDNTDIFFHFKDFDESSGDKENLKNQDCIFSFSEMKYVGKNSVSKKAVQIRVESK